MKQINVIIILATLILVSNSCRIDLSTSEYYGIKTFLKSNNAKSNCNKKADCEGGVVKLKGVIDECNVNEETSVFWLVDEKNKKYSIPISVDTLIKTAVFNKLKGNGGLVYEVEGIAEGFDKPTNFFCDRGIIIKLNDVLKVNRQKKITDNSQSNNSNWTETIGTITESAKMNDGTYAYTLEYNVVGGSAINMDGELIQGKLPQHIFNVKKQAIEGQKIKLRYNKEEPMFYELLEEIVFIK
jgi:hypothetical protein